MVLLVPNRWLLHNAILRPLAEIATLLRNKHKQYPDHHRCCKLLLHDKHRLRIRYYWFSCPSYGGRGLAAYVLLHCSHCRKDTWLFDLTLPPSIMFRLMCSIYSLHTS